MLMQIKKIKSYNISKKLKILRAFIEKIITRKNSIYALVAYRKGRALCRFNPSFKLLYRVEENFLKEKGVGDFRCFTVDSRGTIFAAGNTENYTCIVKINQFGIITEIIKIKQIPVLKSMAVNDKGDLFLHSPQADFSVVTYRRDAESVEPFCSFPESLTGVDERSALIEHDGLGGLFVVYENSPTCIMHYDETGEVTFKHEFSCSQKSVDALNVILDVSVDPASGYLFVLRQTEYRKYRTVEVINSKGNSLGTASVDNAIRRICSDADNVLYSSGTDFSIWGIISSLNLYGAITLIRKNKIIY